MRALAHSCCLLWGLVKSMLGIFASLGILIMYKEQYMIVDEGYVLDISDTVADLDWPPLQR